MQPLLRRDRHSVEKPPKSRSHDRGMEVGASVQPGLTCLNSGDLHLGMLGAAIAASPAPARQFPNRTHGCHPENLEQPNPVAVVLSRQEVWPGTPRVNGIPDAPRSPCRSCRDVFCSGVCEGDRDDSVTPRCAIAHPQLCASWNAEDADAGVDEPRRSRALDTSGALGFGCRTRRVRFSPAPSLAAPRLWRRRHGAHHLQPAFINPKVPPGDRHAALVCTRGPASASWNASTRSCPRGASCVTAPPHLGNWHRAGRAPIKP